MFSGQRVNTLLLLCCQLSNQLLCATNTCNLYSCVVRLLHCCCWSPPRVPGPCFCEELWCSAVVKRDYRKETVVRGLFIIAQLRYFTMVCIFIYFSAVLYSHFTLHYLYTLHYLDILHHFYTLHYLYIEWMTTYDCHDDVPDVYWS